MDNREYVIIGVVFRFCVILIILSVDYIAPLLLLMIWPIWTLYMKFVGSISIIGVLMNEIKKLVTLLLVTFVPNVLLVLVFSFVIYGLLLVVVAGSYLVMSASSSYLFVLLLVIYVLWIFGYRILLLRLIPLPLFFVKVALPWYLVYMVVLIGSSIFV